MLLQTTLTWQCPQCQEELGAYNAYCTYCKEEKNIKVFNPDKYFVREICIYHLITSGASMTPQEELFAQLFNGYKTNPKVNAMSDLELRAHREELTKIAFEARAYVGAVDDILKERKPKGPQGFRKSVNIDDTTTDAINTIKERQKRLTKSEKIQEGLLKMYEKSGMTREEAIKESNSLMKAGTILLQAKAKDSKGEAEANKPPATPILNPFEKKS